jgi:hypothetical protein
VAPNKQPSTSTHPLVSSNCQKPCSLLSIQHTVWCVARNNSLASISSALFLVGNAHSYCEQTYLHVTLPPPPRNTLSMISTMSHTAAHWESNFAPCLC